MRLILDQLIYLTTSSSYQQEYTKELHTSSHVNYSQFYVNRIQDNDVFTVEIRKIESPRIRIRSIWATTLLKNEDPNQEFFFRLRFLWGFSPLFLKNKAKVKKQKTKKSFHLYGNTILKFVKVTRKQEYDLYKVTCNNFQIKFS